MRCTVTDVAWFTLAQPTAAAAADDDDADDDPAACDAPEDDVTWAEDGGATAGDEAVTEPHPASAEHSSTARTVPRTWRGDIMLF